MQASTVPTPVAAEGGSHRPPQLPGPAVVAAALSAASSIAAIWDCIPSSSCWSPMPAAQRLAPLERHPPCPHTEPGSSPSDPPPRAQPSGAACWLCSSCAPAPGRPRRRSSSRCVGRRHDHYARPSALRRPGAGRLRDTRSHRRRRGFLFSHDDHLRRRGHGRHARRLRRGHARRDLVHRRDRRAAAKRPAARRPSRRSTPTPAGPTTTCSTARTPPTSAGAPGGPPLAERLRGSAPTPRASASHGGRLAVRRSAMVPGMLRLSPVTPVSAWPCAPGLRVCGAARRRRGRKSGIGGRTPPTSL